MAAQPVRTLGNLNAIVQEALAALARYFAVMDEAPAVQVKPGATSAPPWPASFNCSKAARSWPRARRANGWEQR